MSNLLLENIEKFKKFTLKRYNTIEDLEIAHWDGQITLEDLKEGDYGAIDTKGGESSMSWEDMKESYNTMGYWGFVDSRDNVIHFWVREDYPITMEELLFFFGHEMGHRMDGGVMPDQDEYSENHEVHFKEENRADEYGYVALMAYKFATEVLTNK